MAIRFLVFLNVLSLLGAGALCADPAPAKEADARLQADGSGWRLQKAQVTDAKRPRVLLVGDSILNGYVAGVTRALEGKAYVDAWVNPYHQASARLHTMVAEVLAQGPYDVIHFNMGLHGWQAGRIPEGEFDHHTEVLVDVLRKEAPKARIIWASTTPVTVKGKPGELDAEIDSVIVEHNRIAANVMREKDVPVNDLYLLLVDQLALARGDQFHWTGPAYKMLGEAVAAEVTKALQSPR